MKRRVAVLGATGTVGQRLVSLLRDHPWFRVEMLAASERSVGMKYGEVCKWALESDMDSQIGEIVVVKCDVESIDRGGDVDLVFSCLPAGVAKTVEERVAVKYPVFSKASTHRLEKDVPLIIPEINPDHLSLINVQRKKRKWAGFISTDPNCSAIQLAMTLKPLMTFGVSKVLVSTMQALSGAGYPGVASLDILGNIIPFIAGEEYKIETETLKILGDFDGKGVQEAKMAISASCSRVNVRDGHTENVFVLLKGKPDLIEVKEAFQNFRGVPQSLRLPSAPENPILVRDESDRPQPIYDKDQGKGMSVVVGRIRHDPALSIKYTCLGHNTLRGAAGAAILTAELAVAKGFV